ncbi:hypothetical protein [Streptomyces misionensis]|uniref:hypothetical protein n=1 Tax=Streptomyces misionensis TaxID=67331 RepID=UPI003692D9C7
MSARDNARKWMIADNADALLDAYAHELAEKQRAWFAQPLNLMAVRDMPTVAVPNMIDLIDPQKGDQ